MKKEQEILLFFVRMATARKGEAFDGRKIDWGRLAKEAMAQAIPTLVLDALHLCLSEYPDYKPFGEKAGDRARRMQWVAQMMATERLYIKHEKTMAELARLYASKGVKMMVLKGYGLSLDWPVPAHRAPGDLDIYNFGKWREADALVAKSCGIKVDEGHEHHTVFDFRGVMVENHYDFINTKAHRDAPKIEARLKLLAEKDCREVEVDGARIYLPSADFNAIFLMRHMGQHFAGEHLNLRQVLDWGFFVRAHHEEVDWKTTIDFLIEIGIYTFFNQINAICVDYLGFAEKDFPTIRRNQELEERILMDILSPEFDEKKPNGSLFTVVWFKLRRWWANKWKHQLVYNDNLPVIFATLALSHLKRIKTIKN